MVGPGVATLGSATCARVTLYVPLFGGWRAEGVLDGGAVPTLGPGQTLTVGDLALVGTVGPAALDAPDRPHFVMYGGAGWDLPVPTTPAVPSYQQDQGVRLSTVLRDLAKLTRASANDPSSGETVEAPTPDVVLGTAFAAPAPRAGELLRVRDVLAALEHAGYLQQWRVDPDGVTRFGPRAGVLVPAATRQTLITRDAGVGVARMGIEAPSAFLPGNLCSALDGAVIRRLVVTETAGALEAEIWGSSGPRSAPSMRNAIRRMTREDFPEIAFSFPRTYVVQNVRSDGRLDLIPPPDAPELPILPAVDQWLPGIRLTPNVGDQVIVQFRDANPTRPGVVGAVPLRTATPAAVTIDAASVKLGDAFARLAREGDTYSLGTASGPLTFVSTLDPNGATKAKG